MFRTSIIFGVITGFAATLFSILFIPKAHSAFNFPFRFEDSKLIWTLILFFCAFVAFAFGCSLNLIKESARKQYLQMKKVIHLKSLRNILYIHRAIEPVFVFLGFQGLTTGIILIAYSLASNKQWALLLPGCLQLCGSLFFLLGLYVAKCTAQRKLSS